MRILYGLLIFISLTACTVGPNYHPPEVTLPAKYSLIKKNDSTKTETHFWQAAVNDPILLDLINQSINGGNFDVQEALAHLRESRARLGIANADYYPRLDMTDSITRERLSANQPILSSFPPGLIPLSYTDYNFKFDASWEIDLFGHTRRNVEASRAMFESEIENQRNVRIAVAAEVASTYTLYRIYQQRILIANQTITSYGKTAHLVHLQMKSGSATGADLDRVQSNVLSAKANLPSLQAETKATLASLAVLVGQTPEDLFTRLNKTASIPHMNSAVLRVGLPSDLLRRRPDIRIAERNLAAANAHIGVAVANEFPRFQLIGDLGSETTQAGTYLNKASILWSVGPQVYIPIFEGGRLRYAVKESEANRDTALIAYRKSVLSALADVESSLIRYNQEQIKQQKLLASYKKLKSSYRLVQLQYQSGETTLLDVLDVQRQLDSLNDQYVQSQGQVTIDLVALYKAVGGDWVC